MKIWHGIHPGYENLILNRIRESRRTYDRKGQRAELLIRNAQFMKEFRDLHEEPKGFKKVCDFLDKHGPADVNSERRKLPDELTELLFVKLCERWGISRLWDMEKATLPSFIETQPSLVYHPIWAGLPFKASEVKLLPNDERPDYLYIKIDPWTALEDIKAVWHRVEETKRAVFGYSDKGKSNFSVALCWYDLNKQYRMSLGKIARLWIQEVAPHIRDEASFKVTVREGIKRISRYIKRLTPQTSLINIPQ